MKQRITYEFGEEDENTSIDAIVYAHELYDLVREIREHLRANRKYNVSDEFTLKVINEAVDELDKLFF